MFSSGRAKYATDSFSKHRASKSGISKSKRSFRDHSTSRRPAELDLSFSKQHPSSSQPTQAQLNSATITISVGHSPARLFAAHVDVIAKSSFFQSALRSQYYNSSTRQLILEDETPEVFSCILEFLYRGDYSPRLEYDARRNIWSLERAPTSPSVPDSTVWIPAPDPSSPSAACVSPTLLTHHPTQASAGQGLLILRDTAVYCAAEHYSLPSLKRIALRKQGLQSGISVATILASAKWAYAHTPEDDRHLRAHYLALIVRSRNTFKRSGTMQLEMGMASPRLGGRQPDGGTGLWFDLFVAMCNHLDDLEHMKKSSRS